MPANHFTFEVLPSSMRKLRRGDLRRSLCVEAVEPVSVRARPIRANVFLNPDIHARYSNVYVTILQAIGGTGARLYRFSTGADYGVAKQLILIRLSFSGLPRDYQQ